MTPLDENDQVITAPQQPIHHRPSVVTMPAALDVTTNSRSVMTADDPGIARNRQDLPSNERHPQQQIHETTQLWHTLLPPCQRVHM